MRTDTYKKKDPLAHIYRFHAAVVICGCFHSVGGGFLAVVAV